MNANYNEVIIPGLGSIDESTAGEGLHNAQYALLNELPGVVFGFLTLAWIITSLVTLL